MIKQWEQKGIYISYNNFGFNVFTIEFGDNKATTEHTLLLVHGFPESSYSYHKVIDNLLSRFKRIILFDFLGFGFSDKPKVNYTYSIFEQTDLAFAVLAHFKIGGCHLIAHDMGNTIATEMIARANQNLLPSWFNKGFLSVTFTNGNMVLENARLRLTQKILLTKFGGPQLSKLSNYALFKQQIKSASGSKQLLDSEVKIMWNQILHKGGKAIFYKLMSYYKDRIRYQNPRWLPALSATAIPINICWGDADSVAPISIARHLKNEVCPNAKLTVMENVGHFGQLENPEVWVKAILGL